MNAAPAANHTRRDHFYTPAADEIARAHRIHAELGPTCDTADLIDFLDRDQVADAPTTLRRLWETGLFAYNWQTGDTITEVVVKA